MFRARSKLQRRDQDSGLVFSWRVPRSSSMSFVVAVLLVGAFSLGIAAFVRVKIGNGKELDERRGTLVVIPQKNGGQWLERMAIQAGPFPVRWNPAADPEYAALRRRALKEATAESVPYQPELLALDFSRRDDWGGGELQADLLLPALPFVAEAEVLEGPRETGLGVRVVRSSKGSRLQIPQLPLGAKEGAVSAGRRFLVEHDADGRIVEVIALDPDDTPADLSGWLSRARVLEHDDKAGWLVVESVIEP